MQMCFFFNFSSFFYSNNSEQTHFLTLIDIYPKGICMIYFSGAYLPKYAFMHVGCLQSSVFAIMILFLLNIYICAYTLSYKLSLGVGLHLHMCSKFSSMSKGSKINDMNVTVTLGKEKEKNRSTYCGGFQIIKLAFKKNKSLWATIIITTSDLEFRNLRNRPPELYRYCCHVYFEVQKITLSQQLQGLFPPCLSKNCQKSPIVCRECFFFLILLPSKTLLKSQTFDSQFDLGNGKRRSGLTTSEKGIQEPSVLMASGVQRGRLPPKL